MKLIEFPKEEVDRTKEIADFMDKVKEIMIEEGITQVVIAAKDDNDDGGTSVYARSRAEALEMLWDSLQNL